MAHAQASDKSQTSLYPGEVLSLAWLFERYSKDLTELCNEIRAGYTKYFTRHFDDVEVKVQVDVASEKTNRVTLRMFIGFSQDGKNYSVGQELYGLNGRYEKTMRIKESGITS